MPVILLLDVSAVIRQAHNAKRVDTVRTSTQGHHGSSRGKVQGQGYFNVASLVHAPDMEVEPDVVRLPARLPDVPNSLGTKPTQPSIRIVLKL